MKPRVSYSGFTWSYHPAYAPPGPELPVEWFQKLRGVGKPPWVTYRTQEEAYRELVAAWDRLSEEQRVQFQEYAGEVERIRKELGEVGQ